MKVDPREILFIKDNAFRGMFRLVSTNINMPYDKVRNELASLKHEYPDDMVIEARRLLKEATGKEFSEPEVIQA